MSDIIIEVVTVEAPPPLTVDVIAPPPDIITIDGISIGAPQIAVIDVADWGNIPVGYPQLPSELAQIPISFPFGDKPEAASLINLPMAFSVRVPLDLKGAVTFARVAPTAPAIFVLNRIGPNGFTSQIGTITLQPINNTAVILQGAGAELAIGDVLQLVAPLSQDPTMADVGITILVDRE